ncbi:hypothetical protein TNIN_430031 [Trichonephila inaurata madagascariensis]|uniref:Uncharacterized protein n=1 Tax=Trichonephila inaurata madagascariensis TaxID=2747483 RepID=A0A8X6YN84_9ARAC|nr:hypothetical protein TNIN_430031 [Trichonephila inaurata madagascariensis]
MSYLGVINAFNLCVIDKTCTITRNEDHEITFTKHCVHNLRPLAENKKKAIHINHVHKPDVLHPNHVLFKYVRPIQEAANGRLRVKDTSPASPTLGDDSVLSISQWTALFDVMPYIR